MHRPEVEQNIENHRSLSVRSGSLYTEEGSLHDDSEEILDQDWSAYIISPKASRLGQLRPRISNTSASHSHLPSGIKLSISQQLGRGGAVHYLAIFQGSKLRSKLQQLMSQKSVPASNSLIRTWKYLLCLAEYHRQQAWTLRIFHILTLMYVATISMTQSRPKLN